MAEAGPLQHVADGIADTLNEGRETDGTKPTGPKRMGPKRTEP